MKILIINYELPPIGGGAGNATLNIAKNMALKGFDTTILTSQFQNLPKRETIEGVKIIRIPTIRKKKESVRIFELLIFALSSLWFVPKHARKIKPDVSLAFFGLPCGISALLIKYLLDIPYIVSLRGADVPGFVEREIHFYHFIAKPLIKLIWRKAFKVITNSQGLRNLALQTCPEVPIEIIPNGVNCNIFQPANVKSLSKLNLLYVGRFSKQKGLEYLPPLMKILKEKLAIPFHFNLIGDGPNLQEIKEKIEKSGLSEHVSFCGWVVDRYVLSSYYKNSSIFVFPSLFEGMPNAILEAMASGLAIVASNVAGNEELVRDGENGFLHNIGDVEGLAESIIHLANSPELIEQYGRRSREIAIEHYSWSHVTDNYLNLLSKYNLHKIKSSINK